MSKPVGKRPFMVSKILLLCILAGTAVLALPASAADKPVVTIVAHGGGSYYLGEEAVFSGMNTDTDSTYLYITGPNLPESGGKLASPDQKTVSGDPGSFTVVKTDADKTWQYLWYTSGLKLDAGTYTVYAVSGPETGDQLAKAPYGTTGIIIKKPYVTAGISPASVPKGQALSVTGIAEGIPPQVRVWIFGSNTVLYATTPVNSDASFTFAGNTALSGNLSTGQYYLIVQHPMADNQFDVGVSGDYVRSGSSDNGTNLFRITGPGSLQGSDAAEALMAAFHDPGVNDNTLTHDTYAMIPFRVTDAGSPALQGTAVPVSNAPGGSGVTISIDGNQSCYLGDTVVFSGRNTDSDTTYLLLTGPNLPAAGAKLTSPHEAVVSGNPDSFTVVKTKPDKTWEYSFATANLPLDAGTYYVYAASRPVVSDPPGSGVGFIIKRPFTGVTISADGSHSYYLGEKVILRGLSPDADTVYLFLTGPNLPAAGALLMSPRKAVVSGNPDSFTVVKTKPDKTWEYAFYTANLPLDAGTYNIYAVGQPLAADQLGPGAAGVGIILKKPFINATISSPDVVRGQPFSVTGVAEGEPPEVQIWIIGDNYEFTTKTPVNAGASFTFPVNAALSGELPEGQNYLFVQHPMQNNQFDIDVSGGYIRNIRLDNGTNLFRITGPGSLQGSDAADALIAAFSDPDMLNVDTYAVIPFRVTDGGSATAAPAQHQAQQSPLLYIPVGGLLLVLGIVLWKQH